MSFEHAGGLGRLWRGTRSTGLAMLLAAGAGGAGGALAEEPSASPSPTSASASGDATIAVSPDRATLQIAVVTEARKSEAAAAANASKGEAVLAALRKALGRDAKIRTIGYSLDPQYDYQQGTGRQLRGYLARNQIEVVTEKLDRIGTAIDAATQAGANDVDSLSFGLADDLGVRLRALDEATRRARQKVDAMAAALGLRVVRIASVAEQGTQHAIPIQPRVMRAEAFDAAASTPVEPGRVEVRAQVVLVAELGG